MTCYISKSSFKSPMWLAMSFPPSYKVARLKIKAPLSAWVLTWRWYGLEQQMNIDRHLVGVRKAFIVVFPLQFWVC